MNKILITFFLLFTVFLQGRSQLVDPGDSPSLNWDIAQIGVTNYTSLPLAFGAVTTDNTIIKLLIGVTLDVAVPLKVDYNTTLNLNSLPLVCTSGTTFEIKEGKALFLRDGTVSGSLLLTGKGNLFAGTDVKLPGVGITAITGSSQESLYRILVELPGTDAVSAGSIKYGKTNVIRYAQQGKILCCWLPHSVAAQAITFAYNVNGSPKKHTTSPLIVTGHAENLVTSEESREVIAGNVAKVDEVEYPTLKAAFTAVETTGGTISLIDNASLGDEVTPQKEVTLDLKGWNLTASGAAKISPDIANASVRISNGYLSGSLAVSGFVIVDNTVTLPAVVTYNGRQSYRTRLLLPSGVAGKTVTFSYAPITNGSMKVLTENLMPVAYVWLPANVASTFTLKISDSSPVLKEGVTIQANHDNEVDVRASDVEAILYKWDEDPSKDPGTPYPTFHEALLAMSKSDGSLLVLKRNVQFAHSGDDKHSMKENVKAELSLNGFSLNASNSILDASAPGSCMLISDGAGTGRITGTFRIKGNVYVSNGIIGGNIGVVQDADDPKVQLYRVLVSVDATDGEMAYQLGTMATPKTCLVKDHIACIWLPVVASGTLTLKRGGESYKAADVHISASHSNTVTVARPGVVAKIGETPYTSLKAAFDAVKDKETISLQTNATLEESLTLPAGTAAVLDLNQSTLTGKGAGAFKPSAGSSLHVKNGNVAGIVDVTESVTIDRSVLLTAAVTATGRQVYRTRLLLTADDKGKTLSYVYGTVTGRLPLLLEEGTADAKQSIAYCWLPAHPSAAFLLKAGDANRTRGDVAIQANHDNNIDLMKGDIEAILYGEGEDPLAPGSGVRFETFHDALNEAGRVNGSSLRIERDVQFSGAEDHSHVIEESVVTELHLCGHNLVATNCLLDASAEKACLLICDADKGTGHITGTFRIKGNVYMSKEIVAGNIGMVLDGGSGTLLYRALIHIDTPVSISDGSFGTCVLGTGSGEQACYIRDKQACVWLPVSVSAETLTLVVNGNTYTAKGIQVIASHSNTFTVRDPEVVAMIGETGYTSLTEAFAKATGESTIRLKQSTSLSVPIAINKDLKLELGEYTLTFQDQGAFVAATNGSLTVSSESERGMLSGNPSFTGNICVSGSVSMSGLVSLTTEGRTATVYRCRLYLPDGAVSGTYAYGEQSGVLRLVGEKNATNQPVSYVWLRSETGTRDLTVTLDAPVSGTRTLTDVLVQATHNNQFDMEASDNVARVGSQYYPSLKTAIDAVNGGGGGTLMLVMDQTLRGIQSVTSHIRFDLNGKKLSLTADAGFDVKGENTLLITDDSQNADKGYLYGTMLINGAVCVDSKVNLSGTMIRKGVEVQRLSVGRLPVNEGLKAVKYIRTASGEKETALVLSGVACLWLPAIGYEEDLQFMAPDGHTYETTLLPGLAGHNKKQDAYRLVRVDADMTWVDDANKDCNVLVSANAVLTLATGGKLKTLHRLTLCNNSQVVCDERVLATGGIVYRRSFAVANRWEAFSLPFEARSITAVFHGEPVSLTPNLSDGTGGHYWLKTLADDGTFNYVTEERLGSNVGYIIAVPANLTTDGNPEMAVCFASAPNQFLQRSVLPAVPPAERGFKQLTTGILCNMPLTQPFYLLNTEGTEYVRQLASEEKPLSVRPFSSYLLADKETTGTLPTLRMGGVTTGNEETEPSVRQNGLKVRAVSGGIIVESAQEYRLSVYTASGSIYIHCRIPEGSTHIFLPAGIYIVNHEKVCVTK